MAVNEPLGDNAHKGASATPQLETNTMAEKRWSKRSNKTGQFMDQRTRGKLTGRQAGEVCPSGHVGQ